MEKMCVIGAGSWGSALALSLYKNGHEVHMWTRDVDQVEEINETRQNSKFLPGIIFPDDLIVSNHLEEVIKNSKIVVLAVPSQAIRSICRQIKPFIKKNQIIVDVAKGLEKGTGLRLSEVVKEELPYNPYVTLSGPSHAEEVSKFMPTTLVAACEEIKYAEEVQDAFMSPSLRVYTNPDIVGVELGGALKNIIAFGAGMCDGLGYGDNTKAALMTRGISEIGRLGVAMGASVNTFTGLAGIGDLIVTCTSMHSRNRRAGILMGQGKSLEETLEEVQMVVEGITATEVAYKVSRELNIDMPITEAIYSVLYNGANPNEAVLDLMTRSKKHEMEETVNNGLFQN
ncbi:NAD(P)H-dependent glycerol-3-phosphate dehydrogenase [Terrisporobacter sp.]|uniref:NAD(P)H-dependent glycerol-3-phosphate dehydrogenase n=1 Tax=Terrisporobacter sp. TaxID=1965305 RepID=UPI00260E7309|nr:NAD(P)H-dependent glycerol-3-phosphate dehydrogenase [Terrisporobacter sp.]